MVGFLIRFLKILLSGLKKKVWILSMLRNRESRVEYTSKSICKYSSDLNIICVIEFTSFYGNIVWVWVKSCVLQNLWPGSLLATNFENYICQVPVSPLDLHNCCWRPCMNSFLSLVSSAVPPGIIQAEFSSRFQESKKKKRLAMNLEIDVHI